MSKIHIETITPEHIGSGNFLSYNTDFVVDKIENDSYLYVIDPNKIFRLIGSEHLNDWILSIENKEDTKAFVKRYAKNTYPENYSKRVITSYAEAFKFNDTLKECLHNGMGFPYIPGSSIKGAIRTAILSSLVTTIKDTEKKIKNSKGKITSKLIEEELFGKDPNSDIFRFIQIGDAYFEKECEIAMKMINLNIRKREDLEDHSKAQVIEAIGLGCKTSFQIKIRSDYYQWAKTRWNEKNKLGKFPFDDIENSMDSLFSLINTHTRTLVSTEIEYWMNLLQEGYCGADYYIEKMQQIIKEIDSCQKGKECILRIGYATGWRFITGAWTENLSNFEDVVILNSRPNNHKYLDYDFPKSRRIDIDGDVLGFVKLSV